MKLAETKAFAVANEEITQKLRGDLNLYKHPVRLSSLSLSIEAGEVQNDRRIKQSMTVSLFKTGHHGVTVKP
jgi:hypothetical protein